VVPFPRYLVAKCCDNVEHIANFGDADYRDEVCKFAVTIPNAVSGLLSLGKIKIFSLFECVSSSDLSHMSTEIFENPASWQDPVHPSPNVYTCAAGALVAFKSEQRPPSAYAWTVLRRLHWPRQGEEGPSRSPPGCWDKVRAGRQWWGALWAPGAVAVTWAATAREAATPAPGAAAPTIEVSHSSTKCSLLNTK
jgi:hypothetical protein